MEAKRDQDSEWIFGPVSGPLCGGLAAAALAVAEPVVGYPGWLPLGLAAAGAGTSALVAKLRRRPLALVAYRACTWLVGGAWVSWAAHDGLTWLTGGVLAGGAVVAGLMTPLAADVGAGGEEVLEGARIERLTARESNIKHAVDGLLNLKEPGVEVLAVTDWPSRSGYTVTLEFPAETGFGEEELQGAVVRLGRRLRLPSGCVPSAEEGDYQGQVLLKVPTLDDLSGEIEYPADYSPLSVNQEHPLGIFGDQTIVMDEVREASKLVGGRKGGGKTNVMDVYGANFARCPDALIWDIDLNGGGMSVPWFVPYVREDLAAPVVDWAATDPAEALVMSEVLLAIVKHRKALYGVVAVDADSRLVPITAECPAIVVRIDEGAEVLGETCRWGLLRDNLTTVMRLGRAVGVNLVVSTLRPTGDHIPVQVRKNCSTRIATRCEEDTELDYMFGYQKGLRSSHLRTKGEAYFWRGDEDGYSTVRKMKFFHLKPSRIADVCRATAHLRPSLPPAEVAVADRTITLYSETVRGVYSTRWNRLSGWLQTLSATASASPLQVPTVGPLPQRTPADPPPASTADALARYQEAKRRAVADEVLGADDAEIESRFAGLVADLLPGGEPGPAPVPAVPAVASSVQRAAMVALIVHAAGESGIMRGGVIAAVRDRGIEVLDQTVSEWLKTAESAGLIRKGRKQGLWIHNAYGGTEAQ